MVEAPENDSLAASLPTSRSVTSHWYFEISYAESESVHPTEMSQHYESVLFYFLEYLLKTPAHQFPGPQTATVFCGLLINRGPHTTPIPNVGRLYLLISQKLLSVSVTNYRSFTPATLQPHS